MDAQQEIENIDKKFQKELNAGISSLVLLSVLSKAQGPMYGYQIAKLVEDSQAGGSFIKLGTLYPVLRALEDNNLLRSEVEPSVTGPPRRYYSITQLGCAALLRWSKIWQQTREMVGIHLEGSQNDK
jgi:PadR family transcriptional regulator, regulatory protein PadR